MSDPTTEASEATTEARERLVNAALNWSQCGGQCKPTTHQLNCDLCRELTEAARAYRLPHFDSEELENITKAIRSGHYHDATWWETVARRMLATVEEPNNCYCGAAELADKYQKLASATWDRLGDIRPDDDPAHSYSDRLTSVVRVLGDHWLKMVVLPYGDQAELDQFGTTDERLAFMRGQARLRGPKKGNEDDANTTE